MNCFLHQRREYREDYGIFKHRWGWLGIWRCDKWRKKDRNKNVINATNSTTKIEVLKMVRRILGWMIEFNYKFILFRRISIIAFNAFNLHARIPRMSYVCIKPSKRTLAGRLGLNRNWMENSFSRKVIFDSVLSFQTTLSTTE